MYYFIINVLILRYSSDNVLKELFFLIILINRGFLISLLRILRDYLVVIYLIKYILEILLRLSRYKRASHYILIINIVGLE